MKTIDKFRNRLSKLREREIDHVMMPPSSIERNLDEIERELEEEYVELPRDANGEHIHIGDKLTGKYLTGNPVVECTRLTLTNGWMVGHGRADGTPELFAHHKPPTVEDVLREFADLVRKERVEQAQISDETVAEFAERLRLREEGE